jgi:hypothetical protein
MGLKEEKPWIAIRSPIDGAFLSCRMKLRGLVRRKGEKAVSKKMEWIYEVTCDISGVNWSLYVTWLLPNNLGGQP